MWCQFTWPASELRLVGALRLAWTPFFAVAVLLPRLGLRRAVAVANIAVWALADMVLGAADVQAAFPGTAPLVMGPYLSMGNVVVAMLFAHDAVCASQYLAPRLTAALLCVRIAAPWASQALYAATGVWFWWRMALWPFLDVGTSLFTAALLRRLWVREAAARADHAQRWRLRAAKKQE